MCTKERGRGRVYLFRRAHTANVTALEHDRVIKEMNSGYGGPPFHTPLPLPLPLFDRRAQPHLLRFASILGCRRTETDLRNPVSILLIEFRGTKFSITLILGMEALAILRLLLNLSICGQVSSLVTVMLSCNYLKCEF